METARLIAGLRRPGALPLDAAAPVEVVQTHASVVVLAGDRAWKVKKEVNLGFLDFSTLAKRRADSEAELELNRRMAPEIYLGLRPVVELPDGGLRILPAGEEPEHPVVDWAVEMVRLPADGMLDRVLARGGPPNEVLVRFARDLVAFHARVPEAPEHGSIEVLERRLEDNLARLARYATGGPEPLLAASFVERLSRAARAWLERIAPHLEARRRTGSVRDGHGDLHARNLCLVGQRLVAYDCLEFEPAYRAADVASEVGFLAMDLDARGRSDLANVFSEAYVAASGDEGILQLGPFFRMHYAIIRSMVEAIRLGEAETPAAERPAIRALARSYAALAAHYLHGPVLIVLSGLPACGKSTLALALSRTLRAAVLRSDEVRKRLAGLAATDRGPEELYRDAMTDITYTALREGASEALGRGRSSVVDCASLYRWQRDRLVDAAREEGAPWLIVEVTATPEAVRERMAARSRDASEPSDATFGVYEKLRAGREPIAECPPERRLALDSERSSDDHAVVVAERMLALLHIGD